MKRLLGSCLIFAALTCSFAVEGQAQVPTYSQTLVPSVLLCREDVMEPPCEPLSSRFQDAQTRPRPNSVTITFTGTPTPATEATLTVTMTGDITEPGEIVVVTGEDGVFVGTLFGDPPPVNVKTRSLTIQLADPSMFAADGRVDITFTIPAAFTAWARLDAATLIYTTRP